MKFDRCNKIYEVIEAIKTLPYDLSGRTGDQSEKIRQEILQIFEKLPKRYRHRVFNALDQSARRYDFSEYGLWQPYIRQLRNRGEFKFNN